MIPLWKILGLEENDASFCIPDDGHAYVGLEVDVFVTETHLVNWLAEQVSWLEITHARGGEWFVGAPWGPDGDPIEVAHPNHRTAIELMVREVHRAIGGAS